MGDIEIVCEEHEEIDDHVEITLRIVLSFTPETARLTRGVTL